MILQFRPKPAKPAELVDELQISAADLEAIITDAVHSYFRVAGIASPELGLFITQANGNPDLPAITVNVLKYPKSSGEIPF